MPTYPAEFALGQPVRLYLEGQRCETTITQRRFDPDEEIWLYKVAGFAACDIPADDLFTA